MGPPHWPAPRVRCRSRSGPWRTSRTMASTSHAWPSCWTTPPRRRRPDCRVAAPASITPLGDRPGVAAQGRHPRRRHGGGERGVAPQRAGMAGPLRQHHDLSARHSARGQGRQQPRGQRTHRGARPAHLARLLRQRLPAPPRGVRRARSNRHGPGVSDPFAGRCAHPLRRGRARGPRRRRLAPLGRALRGQRPPTRRGGHRRAVLGRRSRASSPPSARRLLRIDPGRDGRGRR